jgi:S-adenosylmethionine synthetase
LRRGFLIKINLLKNMIKSEKTYTTESVTSGHPDKMCDQISDAILDACLFQDPSSRVAIESFGGHGLLLIGGEITTKAEVDFKGVARETYKEIGYEDDLKIISNIVCQSPDIAQGVDIGGAGDQGIMYGYATNETEDFLPKGVVLSHKLSKGLELLRKSNQVSWLKPDGKSQVTIKEGKVKSVLISCQHEKNVSQEEIRKTIIEKLIKPVIGDIGNIEILINPTGKFIQGGFFADTGLTGRKIMVDTYGGLISHGGGCFSGKDPSKVDRSAAYMARFVAKNLVSNNFAKECLVSVSYAIGRAEPLMVEVVSETGEDLSALVKDRFDFKPRAIIERFNLLRPIYFKTASYGHFGRPDFPWEEIIKI